MLPSETRIAAASFALHDMDVSTGETQMTKKLDVPRLLGEVRTLRNDGHKVAADYILQTVGRVVLKSGSRSELEQLAHFLLRADASGAAPDGWLPDTDCGDSLKRSANRPPHADYTVDLTLITKFDEIGDYGPMRHLVRNAMRRVTADATREELEQFTYQLFRLIEATAFEMTNGKWSLLKWDAPEVGELVRRRLIPTWENASKSWAPPAFAAQKDGLQLPWQLEGTT